jgi:hypothetical protein
MNTDFEDRLLADMERFTRDVRVRPDMATMAYRHLRKHRRKLHLTLATTAAASAVAIAAATGTFSPATAPAARNAQTTAYVLRHVTKALAPASVDNLIDVSRWVFPPGTEQRPLEGGGSAPWSMGYLLRWDYRGMQKDSAYSPDGQHIFDQATNDSGTQITVLYGSKTWWTAPVTSGGPRSASPGCTPPGMVVLSTGPGDGWPAFIETQLSCGDYVVAGHQLVNGINAVKITGRPGWPPLTVLVDPATYLPIELNMGSLTIDFQWLRPTPANLALLKVAVPAGFQRIAPPAGS